MECQNLNRFWRYDQLNFRGLDFIIGNRGVIVGDFFTISTYKIFNIDVKSTKIVKKMQTMNTIAQKILKIKFFENVGQNWAHFDKKHHFLHKCDLSKITFCDISQGRNELACWNLASAWTKKVERIPSKQNFYFLIFPFLTSFLFVFL